MAVTCLESLPKFLTHKQQRRQQWQWPPPANAQVWGIYSTNQQKLLLSRARRGKQWKPHHPTAHVLCCTIINTKWEGNSTGEKKPLHIFKSQIKPLSAVRIFLASYRLPSVCVSSKGAKLWLRKTKIIYPAGTTWVEAAQNRYRALLLCKREHTSHVFVFSPVTSKLSKKHEVQFLICFSMEWTVMVEERKSSGWKDWEYFGQPTSHLLGTPGMCTYLNPRSKQGWRCLFHLVSVLF